IADKEKFILVPIKSIYTVGRLSTDLILAQDLSISRTHVRICLPGAGSGKALTVEDLDSKFGTFINSGIVQNKRIKPKTPTALRAGDKIRFGALKSIWQLSELKLTTTPSALAQPDVTELGKLIGPLGGSLTSTWTHDCSHLTMEIVTVTVKLLHALLENKPIVSIAYWRALSKLAQRIHVTEDWPNPEDFPPTHPADMPSIKWHPERTKLFAGKTFVFCSSKHTELYGPVVEKAGGACKDLNSGVRRLFLTKSNVVVIQYISSTQSQATETIHSVQDLLENSGLRLVPEYEIGLAILHCSTAKFCNPSYKMMENSLATTESMDSSILVPNTERTQTERSAGRASEFVVPDSEMSEAVPHNAEDDKETEQAPATLAAKPAEKSKPVLITRERKRNNIYLDSSDEDVVVDEPKKPKTSIESKSKPKRKRAIIVDSSDEEAEAESQKHLKKTKTQPEDKAKQVQAVEEEKSPIDESLVNISQLIKQKPKEQKEPEVVLPKRSTRSNQQQETAKPEPAAQRRSLRGKAIQEKPKLTQLQNNDDSEEEEEALFQFKPKAAVPVERAPFKPTQSNAQSAETALPGAKPCQPAMPRISVRNFLEKSHSQDQSLANQSTAAAASQPRKRLRLEQLNESDSDDNENLFQFGNSKKPRQSSNLAESDNDSDDGGMFNFKKAPPKQPNRNVSDSDQDSVSTEPFVSNPTNKSRYIVPKPKQIPSKVNVSGWLTCSGLTKDVKPEKLEPKTDDAAEQKIKVEEEEDDDKLATMKWLATIKDSIVVRMSNLNVSVRSHDETDAPAESKYDGRKNFKKFVKNKVLHPQQRVVQLKRMQLSEGMVTCL
ncbi:hypothetical protein KR222_009588, partial [Zaprionus bogoriensis]